MDDDFREHARILADHCIQVESGDNIVVQAPFVAEPLVHALAAVLAKRGASMHVLALSDELRAPYLDALEDDSVPDHASITAAFEAADGFIAIKGAENTAALADISPEMKAAYTEALEPAREASMDGDWVFTQFPGPGDAQAAGMSTTDYQEFIADAVSKDWDAQIEFQRPLADRLEAASEVRIKSNETDIRFSVEGMAANNGDARKNLPGSEVATAPIPESVEGEVLFDIPVQVQGSTVENVQITFVDGEVDEYSAEKGEDLLAAVLSTDEGASRLGEFGIGMNREIDRPTRNILFDEKMGDTVHLALGHSLPGTLGPDRNGNESAVHEDLLVDMRQSGTLEFDGIVVYKDGVFRWEDDFVE